MGLNGLKRLVVWILIIQIALPLNDLLSRPATIAQASPTPQAPTPKTPKTRTSAPHPFTLQILDTLKDPISDALFSPAGLGEADEVGFHFVADDPVLDRDPYFMRSQSWVAGGSASWGAKPSENFVQLQLDETGFLPALRLEQPFHEVGRTDDFIFLAANDEHFFDGKVLESEDSQSQGLFLLHRKTWEAAAVQKSAVPVFFLPLPEGRWGKTARVVELPNDASVAITDGENGTFPLELASLEILIKGEKLTLQMATMMGLAQALEAFPKVIRDENKAAEQWLQSFAQAPLPAVGSTAGFGVIFTGINLEHPEQTISLETGERVTATDAASSARHTVAQGLSALIWSKISTGPWGEIFGVPSASAQLSDVFKARLLHMAAIEGAAAVLSVFLLATVYRHFFAKQSDKARLEGKRPTWLGRNTRYFFSTYAHTLWFVAQIPGSMLGNLVDVLADRYFPKVASSSRGGVRKFLNLTVLRSRDNAKKVPVNAKTMFQGTLLIGGNDVLGVWFQTYYVVPMMMKWTGEHFASLKPQADEALGVGISSHQLDVYKFESVAGNAVAYWNSGATTYSGDLQSLYRQAYIPIVDREMRKAGLNPEDPANLDTREIWLNRAVEAQLKAKGLPGKDEFLFDFSTVYDYITRRLGFDPEAQDAKGRALIGGRRPAIVFSMVKDAIRRLQKIIAAQGPSAESTGALKLLKGLQQDMEFLQGWVKTPLTAILLGLNPKASILAAAQTAADVRREVVSVTFAGGRIPDLSMVPSRWIDEAGESAARTTFQLLRESFFDYISGIPDQSAQVQPGSALENQAYENAIEELKFRLGILPEQPLSETQMAQNALEFNLIFENEKSTSYHEAQNSIEFYQPPPLSWMQKWQLKRALRKTDEDFLVRYKTSFNPEIASAEEAEFWKDRYAIHYAKVSGLHPQQWLNSDRAADATRRKMNEIPIQNHLATLNPLQRAQFEAEVHAMNEIDEYVKATSADPESDAVSQAQPGMTQWIRQGLTPYSQRRGRLSRIGYRILRFVDSLTVNEDSQVYRPGALNLLKRNVPFLYDTIYGIRRTFYNVPTALTAGFLFNRFVWGSQNLYAASVFSLLLYFTVYGPSQTLNRIFQNQGIKPMKTLASTMLFGAIYTWATFGGFFPAQFWMSSFISHWDASMAAIAEGASALYHSCARILTGGGFYD